MTISRSTIAQIRFGYGFHPAQSVPQGPEDVLAQVRAGARAPLIIPVTDRAGRRDLVDQFIAHQKAGNKEQRVQVARQMRHGAWADVAGRIYQRALSPHGMYERLAAFWADHFTIAARNAGRLYMLPTFEIDAIRPHIMGRFEEMLIAVVQHPSMLHHLDQVHSFGPGSRAGKRLGRGLNENLAREILELHTVGVDGPYTQKDVREFAELLTGYGTHHMASPAERWPSDGAGDGRRFAGSGGYRRVPPAFPAHGISHRRSLTFAGLWRGLRPY